MPILRAGICNSVQSMTVVAQQAVNSLKVAVKNRFSPSFNIEFHRAPCCTGPRDKGFTLIELSVVILVIAMAAVLVFPLFAPPDSVSIRKSARETAAFLRYLHDNAVSTKSSFRVHFDISDSTMSVSKLLPGGEESSSGDPFLKRRKFSEGITIADVLTSRTGKLAGGEGAIEIGPAGFSDVVVIHLTSSNNRFFTVTAFPATGKVKVTEGYREELL